MYSPVSRKNCDPLTNTNEEETIVMDDLYRKVNYELVKDEKKSFNDIIGYGVQRRKGTPWMFS
jgi:predicted CopG family antitoxin